MDQCELDCCFVQRIDCSTKMPPESCDFVTRTDNGYWDSWGSGEMTYRNCIKCGLIEYSKFKKADGTIVDIDQIYHQSPMKILFGEPVEIEI